MKKKIPVLLPYIFLGLLTLSACWLFAGRHGIFGAKVDWLSQHSVLPAYFRQQFYETGDLFPEFAPNIGGGQNIFNFSYYGSSSPIVLLSYLLPSVTMSDYLMAASIAGLILSSWIFYYWLGTKRSPTEIRLCVSALFLLAGPMIYQSCHHIMFVNYMPFLCMALLGVDRHLEKNRSGLYIISVTLMILSSFYFSIGGILVLTLYGISQYIKLQEQRPSPGRCIKDSFAFLLPTAAAILMSGVLLLPTAYALSGKRQSVGNTDIPSLFLPRLPSGDLLYTYYGIGLPTLILTVLIVGITYRKWQDRVLTYSCILILILPVFTWLLNGRLYVRGKALIPFLPLLCYMTAVYLEKQRERKITFPLHAAAHICTICLLYHSRHLPQWHLILADAVLMSLCSLLFWRSRQILLLIIPPIAFLLLSGCVSGSSWGLADQDTYAKATDKNIGRTISQVLDEEPQLCRLEQRGSEGQHGSDLDRIWDPRQWISSLYSSSYNTEYQRFWKKTFLIEEPFRNVLMQASSNNPLYQKLMGIKYIVKDTADTGNTPPAGYGPYRTKDGLTVYKNKDAAPIAYATDRVITEQDYSTLTFPYDQIALMRYAVVKNAPKGQTQWKKEIKTLARPAKLLLPQIDNKTKKASYMSDGIYRIKTKENIETSGRIEGTLSKWDTLLYLRFHVKNNCPSQDISIWVNGTRNRLSARSHIYYNGNTTFTYVSGSKERDPKVKLIFGKGDYEISDIKCFLGDRRVLEDGAGTGQRLYQAGFEADKDRTKGNTIQGNIQMQKPGWLVTSIPYDAHFEILVDGKKTNAEKVNTAFLGTAIEKGVKNVKIIYHAPGAKTGKLITCAGILLCGIILYIQKGQRKKYIRLPKIEKSP